MCAAPNSQSASNQKTSTSSTKQVPNWLKMKQQNKSSAGKNAKPIVQKPSGSAQKPQQTRNEKRARWAKKSKPIAKPIVRSGPVKEYISACCSASATKPPCGQKEATKDPESGKTKDKAKGLGHFRCSQCKKVCKVTPRKPAEKETGNMGWLHLDPYPAKLHTPAIAEVTIAAHTV